MHPRSLPAEVIADLQDVQLAGGLRRNRHGVATGSRWLTTFAGTPTAIAPAGTDSRTTAPAPITARSPIVTPSRIFAPAPSHAPSPIDTPLERRALSQDRRRRIGEIVIAANHVAVRRDQRVAADADPAGREQFAVEADVRAVAELDVPVLAREDGVATDEHAVADDDALVARSLGVEQTVVVDYDVAPMRIFPGCRSTTFWPNTTPWPQAPRSDGYRT